MILLGEVAPLASFMLVSKRRRIVGSFIGSIGDTQEMLDYCAANNISSEVEVIEPGYINQAFDRALKGDVRYRFVIDMKKLTKK